MYIATSNRVDFSGEFFLAILFPFHFYGVLVFDHYGNLRNGVMLMRVKQCRYTSMLTYNDARLL